MPRTVTMLKKSLSISLLTYWCLLIGVVLTAFISSPGGGPRPAGVKDAYPPHRLLTGAPASYWGPLRLNLAAPAANDPIQFRIQCDKSVIRLGESIELTITAELLNIPPSLLFFHTGASAYTLKMLLPPGFEQTGGELADYVTDELFFPSHSLMTYRIQGRFQSFVSGTSFRLLRGPAQRNGQDLFVEKATVDINDESEQARAVKQSSGKRRGETSVPLYVITGPTTTSVGPTAASYKGYLDFASCNAVSGWVMDINNPRQSPQVDIYINGVKVYTVQADQARQDVANTFGVKDYNKYGYVWVIPDSYKANIALTLSVRLAGTSQELSGSPSRTASCPGTGVSPPTTLPTATTVTSTSVSTTDTTFSITDTSSIFITAPTKIVDDSVGTGGYASSQYVAVPDQGWSGADMKFIDNGIIRVGFKRSVGACITWMNYVGTPNDNFINDDQNNDALPGDPRYGTTFSDKGRQLQFGSDYWSPSHNFVAPSGQNTNKYGFDTGANTVQGGSLAPYYAESKVLASAIYVHPTRGIEFYAKIRPKYWGVPNDDGPMIIEEWVSLKGTAAKYFVRHTKAVTSPPAPEYGSAFQENPCAYLAAPFYRVFTPLGKAGSKPVDRTVTEGGGIGWQRSVFSSECWMGAFRNSDGQGLILYTPRNSAFTNAQFNNRTDWWNEGGAGYIAANTLRNYNNPGRFEDDGYIILGRLSQVRQKIAALEAPDQSLNFDMSKMDVTGGAKLVNGEYVVPIGEPKYDNGVASLFGGLFLPPRAWQASQIQTIHIDMKIEGGGSTLNFKWIKPGQVSAAGTEFIKPFNIIGDGVRRTYTITTADPNWNGIISQIAFQASSGTAIGSKATVYRVWKN